MNKSTLLFLFNILLPRGVHLLCPRNIFNDLVNDYALDLYEKDIPGLVVPTLKGKIN